MNVSIIAIGDELLIGQVIDTNSGDIAVRLNPMGWKVNDVQVIADNADDILRAIDRAFELSDVVITTGGLGPTKDDITKATLCRYFGGELVEDPEVLDNVKRVIEKRGLKMNELTERQALVPTSCEVIQNLVGTAPIMWFEHDGKVLVAMPGVPFETREMLDKAVLPKLVGRFPIDGHIEHRNVMVTGYSESLLAMTIADWEDSLPEFLHLAYLPNAGIVRLRIDGHHRDEALLRSEINYRHSQLVKMLGSEHVLADKDIPLEEILLQLLIDKKFTISTAESCTGGNIAHLLTSIPGSSEAFKGSVIAYSNEVKHNLLGVNEETLRQFGAVSRQVVEQMAEGVCRALGTDCAIATSGIAGPAGGSDEKPVGTVWIAVRTPERTFSFSHRFPGNRQRVIFRASMAAMIMAVEEIRKN
ncbi:MAG: CinA family nicotinamide mononucleotide deamidase-related protein [Muribaculum sp.]|nr:CinA family nicotinamide mononucleotide deamidase-related protein [Muribaculum sp.]